MTQESVRKEILAHIAHPWFAIRLSRACECWDDFVNSRSDKLIDPHQNSALNPEEVCRWMRFAAKTTYPGGLPKGTYEVVAP